MLQPKNVKLIYCCKIVDTKILKTYIKETYKGSKSKGKTYIFLVIVIN